MTKIIVCSLTVALLMVFGGLLLPQHSPTPDTADVAVDIGLDPTEGRIDPSDTFALFEADVAQDCAPGEVFTSAFRALSPTSRLLMKQILIAGKGLDDAVAAVTTGRSPDV